MDWAKIDMKAVLNVLRELEKTKLTSDDVLKEVEVNPSEYIIVGKERLEIKYKVRKGKEKWD